MSGTNSRSQSRGGTVTGSNRYDPMAGEGRTVSGTTVEQFPVPVNKSFLNRHREPRRGVAISRDQTTRLLHYVRNDSIAGDVIARACPERM